MSTSNWPNNFDLSHPNWTGATPSKPKHSWQRYDGKGGYAPNSGRIPLKAWPIAALVIACAIALIHVGAAAGF